MKKIALVIAGFWGVMGIASAQTVTNVRALNEATLNLKIKTSANYAKALAMAKEKGWSLGYTTAEGTKVKLMGVDFFNKPLYFISNNNAIAAATTRANQLWPGGASGLNLDGSTPFLKNKIGVWDGGTVFGTHVELAGRVTQKDNPSEVSDHATHVSGTMIAKGVNPSAKGMAYNAAGLVAYDWDNDLTEMSSEAANLVISNHSYSVIAGWNRNADQNNRWEFNGLPGDTADYKFGYYSQSSADLDDLAYNAPNYLVVKSAGNTRTSNGPAVGQPYFRPNAQDQMISAGNRPAGISSNDLYDGISWDCGAKNILTVGAIAGLPNGYSRKEDAVIASFSSWGPTDDGRIKPDVVADGVNVLSSVNTSTTAYAAFSGTSMSAPNATGSLFLLQEYYYKLKTAFLRSATLKGLAIHTADETGSAPGPDYQFGWGLLNVEKAASMITAAIPSNNAATSESRIHENTLAQGQTFTTTVVASGKGPLKATISWTDVKGAVSNSNVLNNRTKNLVNDLDIRITKGAGATLQTYLPWTLNVNNPSAAAVPGDNNTDNVERIDIDSTIPGQTYTVTITHKGTLVKGPQAYSLLMSGIGGTAYCTSTSAGGGARVDSISFKNLQLKNTAGAKTYTDNTKYVADIEPGQTSPIDIRINTSDASSNQRVVKVFIDFNNNGVFETSEQVAASGVLSGASQTFTANIVTPTTLVIGNTSLMRVIVQEATAVSDVNACGNYSRGETQDYRVHVINPSTDVMLSEIVSPVSNDCATTSQYITVRIKNNGAASQSNIPITVAVATGGTTVANLSFTYPGPIEPLSNVTYTFQSPLITAAASTYVITATTNLTGDQFAANNSLVSSFVTAPKPAAVTATGAICGTNVTLKVTNASSGSYFWYTTATGTTPFATGSTINTTASTLPANNTVYVAKETRSNVGPVNKAAYPSGGYAPFSNSNYVKINNSVPMKIESARLYIGYPGKIKFTVGTITSTQPDGSIFYQPISSSTIDVYATTPNVVAGAQTINNAADTGAIYMLNLSVPTTGDHIIITECLPSQGRTDTATIYRSAGVTGTVTYPFAVPSVFSITGNSAGTASQFYYYFYDMRISTTECLSDRVAVLANPVALPVIAQRGDSLVVSNGSATNFYQWFVDGVAVPNITVNHYKPTKSGKYKVSMTDENGCQQTSAEVTFSITATIDVTAREIGLSVSPNPNTGVFNLSFEVTTKADLSIEIMSASGQRVYNNKQSNFVGKFNKTISIGDVSSEFYILKIQHDKKTYLQKLLIQR